MFESVRRWFLKLFGDPVSKPQDTSNYPITVMQSYDVHHRHIFIYHSLREALYLERRLKDLGKPFLRVTARNLREGVKSLEDPQDSRVVIGHYAQMYHGWMAKITHPNHFHVTFTFVPERPMWVQAGYRIRSELSTVIIHTHAPGMVHFHRCGSLEFGAAVLIPSDANS